ncbi:hypothetical protein L1049_000849 [Liquidambar formosana]|uniref:non-specific serine/threonine protein kinase n=1 Tax=Liquidambar formosana TaxID=63359 RepID=A0AAP0NB79_LIQFO
MKFALSTSKSFSFLLLVLLMLKFRSDAQFLPEEEVQTLVTISTKLQNKHWNISRTSCTQSPGLNVNITRIILSNVTCNCSFNSNTVCHVTNIQLKGFNLTGVLPAEFGNLAYLREIDLSFNRLTGQIPETTQSLTSLNYLFLTNNSLYGAVPSWILDSKQNFDVSYNNFSDSSPASCQQLNVNLVSSYSSLEGNAIAWCLRKDLPCPSKPQYHSLFINCGGSKMTFEGNEYEEDLAKTGTSNFFALLTKWAYSSTGAYMGKSDANYIASNTFSLNVTGADYYQTARLAPISLKYYGLCLRKGSYRVQLHFAEIMYSDDQTYNSLGKRIFDVSIQGNVVLKDFNIMEEAKGVGKGITMNFPNVSVIGSTLEIHLYWSGKGTTAVPDSGVYGPLISAITVTPNFDVDTGLSVGAIVGIVVASCVVLALILVVLRMKGFLGRKDFENKELRGLVELQTGYFTLRRIKAATNNFDPANKIGEGGFGPVYKGVLSDGAIIAVKQLSSKSKQGNREFVNEIGMISALQHPNLVRLHGCCIEGNQLLLVYEYMENNSLARALFGFNDRSKSDDNQTESLIFLFKATLSVVLLRLNQTRRVAEEMEFVLLNSKNISLLLLLLLVINCFAEFRSDAQVLEEYEVQILKTIATKLNYKYWNVNSSSCNGLPGLIPLNKNFTEDGSNLSNVTCNCTFNGNTTCHVTNIDLSFNRLTGPIPGTADSMENLDYLFLTKNSFNGEIPSWILDSNQRFDVSYNNFSKPTLDVCMSSEVNLVSSYSYSENETILWCLKKDLPCPHKPRYHTLRINCGGKEINIQGKKYESDLSRMGPSYFSATDKKNWAYSSTGVFTGKSQTKYIVTNSLNLSVMDPEYYQTVRLAPLSLKYYALCLRKGNYTVRLHFAEIMYTGGQNYGSNGRRIFDIFIQGKLERKDFNIIDKANVAELRGLIELQTGYFTLRQIKAATNNFDSANKIGEGGFGPVYKGVMSDGTIIAVKQLSSKSKQGNREFVNEIGMISALQHPNLVRLYGCCIEGNQLLLIYEYMENNSLARALFGRGEHWLNLGWRKRKEICLGIAKGLAYLHEESRLKIVHRDIKATNVLLDKDLNAKISDFGLAKLDEEENTHISTRIAGTM